MINHKSSSERIVLEVFANKRTVFQANHENIAKHVNNLGGGLKWFESSNPSREYQREIPAINHARHERDGGDATVKLECVNAFESCVDHFP